jgi:hypothetical protein
MSQNNRLIPGKGRSLLYGAVYGLKTHHDSSYIVDILYYTVVAEDSGMWKYLFK